MNYLPDADFQVFRHQPLCFLFYGKKHSFHTVCNSAGIMVISEKSYPKTALPYSLGRGIVLNVGLNYNNLKNRLFNTKENMLWR